MRCAACGTTCKCIQFVLRMQAHCARLCARLTCVSRQTNIRTRLPRTRWRLTSRVRPLCRTRHNPTPWLAAALVGLESLDQGRENCGQHAQRSSATGTGRMSTGRTSTGRMSTGRMSTRAAKRRRAGAQAQGAQVQPHARRRLRARDELDAPARSSAPRCCVTILSKRLETFSARETCSLRVAGLSMASQPVRLLGFSSSEFRFEHPAACAENQKKPHSKGYEKLVCDFFQTFPDL